LNQAPYATRADNDPENAWPKVEEIIRTAIADAYSDRLPADPPNVHRSLDVRRRAYVQLAALHAVNYSPAFRDDPMAGVYAMTKVNAALALRDQATRPAPPAPVAPAAPVQAPLAVMPAEHQALADRVEALMQKMIGQNRKFTGEHVAAKPLLKRAATEYLERYADGSNPKMDAMLREIRADSRAGTISDEQARAVLNVWLFGRRPRGAGK